MSRRQKLMDELADLGNNQILPSDQSRVRHQAEHKDAAYLREVQRAQSQVLPTGGYQKGSGYHADSYIGNF
jgi:hypothetical protein